MGKEVAFRFDIPLYVHVKDGKIVRVVVDDEHPEKDTPPKAIVRDTDGGWSSIDEVPPTKEDVELWFSVRDDIWPGWDFSW